METRDAVVVGAGITGLTAAFYLSRAGLDPLVLEAAEQVGGVIRTHHEDGWCFELGPNTVLEKEPVARLVQEAGLEAEVVPAAPAGRRRYIWKGDRLHPLPSGPLGLLRTPLFPLSAKLRLLREPWVERAERGEESIASFVRRRLGRPWLDYAVGPFVSGVYAGDPERLSVRWAVPRIHSLESEHGSLIRGALARRKGPAPGGRMITFRGGLQDLPRLLSLQAGEVRTGARVRQLRRQDDEFALVGDHFRVRTRRLVLALPAEVTAELLAPLADGGSRELAAIPYAPVAVVGLGYQRDAVAHPLDGFGFLAPRRESLRILGCLFTSSLFPGRAPEGRVALTVFAGGRRDPELPAVSNDELLAVVQDDLARALGVRGEPTYVKVARWPRAIPQYELGHGRYVELVGRLEKALPGLFVAGNFVGGVSVPDSVLRGRQVAERLVPVLLE